MAQALAKTAARLPFKAERDKIAAALDDRERAWGNVNSVPEVSAARARSDELRRASDEASAIFSAVFESYAPRNVDARLARKFPGVLVLGTGEEDYMQWIPRCAVTRLPIFVGDRVYIGGKDEHQRTYILADAVTLAPGFETEAVFVNEDGEADLQKQKP
jgi:hypothetical protein